MGVANFRPAKGSIKKRKRVGRGNAAGQGGECGRGHKGQKSRTGHSMVTGFEGGQTPLYRRIPKKRGHRNRTPIGIIYAPINLDLLEKWFNDGDVVTTAALHQKGLVQKQAKIKILGMGELTKKLTIKAHKISKNALEKIQKANAVFEILN